MCLPNSWLFVLDMMQKKKMGIFNRILRGQTLRHLMQKVCWQGRTRDEVSSLSRHTEHSRRSFSNTSSIVTELARALPYTCTNTSQHDITSLCLNIIPEETGAKSFPPIWCWYQSSAIATSLPNCQILDNISLVKKVGTLPLQKDARYDVDYSL